jgi:1,2-diacylglycerol 3-alpha-glucosyltransferase
MITDVYFPRVNGVSTSIRTFIAELENQGHKVTLIAPLYTVEDDLDDGPGEVIRIPSRKVPFDPEDRLMKRRLLDLQVVHLGSRSFDMLHIHTPFVAHYAGISLARKLGLPVVETFHTYFEEYLYHYLRFLPRSWLRWAARRFTRSQSAVLDAMVVPSVLMKEVLLDYGVERPLHVIPTGLDKSRFEGGDGALFRRTHGIEDGRPVLCHVGRSAHEKNIDFLLEMLVLVRKQVPGVLLVLAGEGPARAHLEARSKTLGLGGNVLFVDYLDRDTELKDCYRSGDAFVFSSRTETQGLVLLEAMALGVPVVSTAVLGTVDILQHGKGALVPEDELEDFASKVVRMLGDSALRSQKSREAVEYARSWSAEEMNQRMYELYIEVVHGRESELPVVQQASETI